MSSELSSTLSSADSDAANPAGHGGNLRVSLACPKCDHAGWIAWQNLGKVIHCPECRCRFQIGRLGKLELRNVTPLVRYTCPRCRQSGELPGHLTVRGVECMACQLTLVVGLDGKLHDAPEAAQLRKTRQDQSHSTRTATQSDFGENAWFYQPAKLLSVLSLLAVLVLGFFGWYRMSSDSPAARVNAFTEECLAGDWPDALEYVVDDPVQHAEFARWRVWHFTSILDKHRPSGDRMHIQPELLHELEAARTYRVVLRSNLIGKRAHQQIWKSTDGQWHFDVIATLALSRPAATKENHEESEPVLPGGGASHGKTMPPGKTVPKLPNNPYSRQR